MAFFDTQPSLQNSDEERIDFAKSYLEDLRFLYKDSNDVDKKVCDSEHDPSHLSITYDVYQKWKGLFRSPFVLQTFAAHLGAIEGSVKVPDLHGLDKPTPVMAGGLGLAAASVRTEHFPRIILTAYTRWKGH